MKQIRELDEKRQIAMRAEKAEKKQREQIVEKIYKRVQIFSKCFVDMVDPMNLEEVFRRFSVLTKPFISECLSQVHVVHQKLNIRISAETLVSRTIALMEEKVILVPSIGPTECVVIRQRAAELLSSTVTNIRINQVQLIRHSWLRNHPELNKENANFAKGIKKKFKWRKRSVNITTPNHSDDSSHFPKKHVLELIFVSTHIQISSLSIYF